MGAIMPALLGRYTLKQFIVNSSEFHIIDSSDGKGLAQLARRCCAARGTRFPRRHATQPPGLMLRRARRKKGRARLLRLAAIGLHRVLEAR